MNFIIWILNMCRRKCQFKELEEDYEIKSKMYKEVGTSICRSCFKTLYTKHFHNECAKCESILCSECIWLYNHSD